MKPTTRTWALTRAFLSAEAFKLCRWVTARVTFVAMCVTPPALIGAVWPMETDFKLFPQVVQAVGASLWLLSGLTSMLLTASSLGTEFEQGTARVTLGRGTPRWLFITGKATVLLGATVLNAFAAWFCGGVMAVLSHLAHAGTEGLFEGVRVLLTSGLAAVGVVVLTAAAYIGPVMVIGVLARSTAFTTFGGLGLFMVDFLLSEFSFIPGLEEVELGTFSILSDTNLLLNQLPFALGANWGATKASMPHPAAAALTLACYAIGGISLACFLFRQQDLTSR